MKLIADAYQFKIARSYPVTCSPALRHFEAFSGPFLIDVNSSCNKASEKNKPVDGSFGFVPGWECYFQIGRATQHEVNSLCQVAGINKKLPF